MTVAVALAASAALAQQPPAAKPAVPEAEAPRPSERPKTAPKEADPAPEPIGRLIPPDPATAPDKPADAEAAPPASSGSLIPPEPEVPAGPPAPELLRESDFDHAACRLELRRLGVEYREIPAITDPTQRDCGIARPVEITAILPGIAVEGGAAMRCDTARALAHWMQEIVVPAAARLPGAPRPTGLTPGTTYHCRAVVGNGAAQNLSEHAVGNAIDIAAFGFDDGTRIEIAPPGDRGDLTVAFQNAVQASACLFFTTVLGPGSNAAHDDHLHLDIKTRRGGFRLCQ